MKQNKKKIIGAGFLLITIFLFIGTLVNANAEEVETSSPQKGDLRCPQTLSSNAVKCNEIKDANGTVIEVDITYGSLNNNEDIQIVKKVKKKDVLGSYDVEFELKGDIDQKNVQEPAYVSIILDMSQTIKNKEKPAVSAAKKLAKTLVPNNGTSNFYISLWQFGTNPFQRRKLENKNLDDAKFLTYDGYFKKNGHKSFVDKAFKNVYNELKNKEGKKYVILLGDGYYWWPEHTNVKQAKTNSDNLRNIGAEIFILRYNSAEDKETQEARNTGNSASCYKLTKKQCNINNMLRFMLGSSYTSTDYYKKNGKSTCVTKTSNNKKYTQCTNSTFPENYYENPSTSKYEEIFEQIANKIIEESGNSKVMAELNDEIGKDFFLEEASRFKHFNIGQITKNGTKTDSFEIQIDQYAEKGWHETNEKFTFTYTNADGEQKTITVNDNPEVYWIPTDLTIHSCSGSALADTIRDDTSDEYSFYSKICYEGYMENNTYHQGFQASVKVNNLNDGEDKFNILSGLGFPTDIKLSTNLVCNYKFDYQAFNTKLAELNTNISKVAEGSKEWYSLVKERDQKVLPILDAYIKLIKAEDLYDYEQRFKDQSASLNVDYNNSKNKGTASFENKGDVDSNISCTNRATQMVNGKSVIVDMVCHASFQKEMQLSTSCLDMKTGEQIDCTNSNSEISGGNKFYTELQQTGGTISVNIPKAGYRGNLDINLKKVDNEKGCEFTADNKMSNITYRQIDLADPFIKNYNGNRQIGRNYLNNQYSFVGIIREDTWDDQKNPFEYRYRMGKFNVANIRKDSSEEGVSSYLGRNCYFNSNNKYVCNFTRNQTEDGASNEQHWFTTIEVNR